MNSNDNSKSYEDYNDENNEVIIDQIDSDSEDIPNNTNNHRIQSNDILHHDQIKNNILIQKFLNDKQAQRTQMFNINDNNNYELNNRQASSSSSAYNPNQNQIPAKNVNQPFEETAKFKIDKGFNKITPRENSMNQQRQDKSYQLPKGKDVTPKNRKLSAQKIQSSEEFTLGDEKQGYMPANQIPIAPPLNYNEFEGLNMNLNQNPQSNYIPNYPPQSQMQYGTYGSYPPQQYYQYPYGHQVPNYDSAYNARFIPNEQNEVFLMQTKIMELMQVLTREQEVNHILDSKCTEYILQLEKSAKNFEEFKNKVYEQNSNYEAEIEHLEEKIRELTERLSSTVKEELQETEESLSLRRKLQNDNSSRSKNTDDNNEELKKITKMKREEDNSMDKTSDDILKIKKQLDIDRTEIASLRGKEEKLLVKINELETYNREMQDKNKELQKIIEDKSQKLNLMNIENENLKNQTNHLQNQNKKLLEENDNLRTQLFDQKQIMLDYDKRDLDNSMTLEKLEIEINQTKTLLNKTEKNLENEKRSNADLRREINNNQKEITELNLQIKTLKQNQSNYLIDSGFTPSNQKSNNSNYQDNTEGSTSHRKIPSYNQGQFSNQTRETKNKVNDNNNNNNNNGGFYGLLQKNNNDFQENNRNENIRQDKLHISKSPVNSNAKFGNNILAWDDSPEKNSNITRNKAKSISEFQDQDKQQQYTKANPYSKYDHNQNEKRSFQPDQDRFINNSNNNNNNNNNKVLNQGKANIPQDIKSDEPRTPFDKIKILENNLMNLQIERTNLQTELQKIENEKKKSGALIKRRQELEYEIEIIQSNINTIKNKLRELNALHNH